MVLLLYSKTFSSSYLLLTKGDIRTKSEMNSTSRMSDTFPYKDTISMNISSLLSGHRPEKLLKIHIINLVASVTKLFDLTFPQLVVDTDFLYILSDESL